MTELLDAAIGYAREGLPVFPCHPGTKRPLIDHGFKNASTDNKVINGWWQRWPDAMIGVPTGAASGVWVLDVDDPGAFEAACSVPLPATQRCDTHKGYHLYFHYDPAHPLRNAQRHPRTGWPIKSLPGAEVRGEGGYVIVPPSVHPEGTCYTWANQERPATAPVGLLEAIARAKGSERNELAAKALVATPAPVLAGNGTAYGQAALRAECDAVLSAGNGEQEAALNQAALKVGALVAGGELEARSARSALVAAGMAMPSYNPADPWTLEAVTAKVDRGLTDGGRNPRKAPDPVGGLRSRAGQEVGEANDNAGNADNVVAFKATPFGWPNPASIPRRCWLFGYWLLRGEITAIVAPGGVGKSTFTTAAAVSMASGRDFLEKSLPEGALSVWLWNLEDGREELDRQVSACAMRHGVSAADCGRRLYVDSGLDQRLCTATETADGVQIVEPVYEALKSEIELRGIDVLIVDPFVSSHEVDENMNAKIDRVAKRWKRLATETACSIVLVHHTKKMGGREVKAEDSRGAVALINAARSTLVFNPMTREEAERFGITERADQRRHVRVDDDKPNRAPPESAWWMKLESVDLGNGDGLHPSDKVGAATPWTPPDPFEGLSVADLYAVQQAVAAGEWGHSVQATDWVGHAVAAVLGLSASDKTDKARIGSLLRGWLATGSLVVERRQNAGKGREKPFVVVGNWVDPAQIPTVKSGVGNVG